MTKARALLPLLAALIVTAIGVAAPATAGAFTSSYHCSMKPSGQWCDGRANGTFDGLHSWDWNEAEYTGSPAIWVCEHVWRPSTGGELGSSCGSGWVGHYYGNVSCVCYEAEVKHVSGGPHTIWGWADAAF